MEWIKCTERLPIQQPEGIPTYNWVVVCSEKEGDEPWPLAIGRYTDEGWDLWLDSVPYCPCIGDTSSTLDKDEITHWMEIKKIDITRN